MLIELNKVTSFVRLTVKFVELVFWLIKTDVKCVKVEWLLLNVPARIGARVRQQPKHVTNMSPFRKSLKLYCFIWHRNSSITNQFPTSTTMQITKSKPTDSFRSGPFRPLWVALMLNTFLVCSVYGSVKIFPEPNGEVGMMSSESKYFQCTDNNKNRNRGGEL